LNIATLIQRWVFRILQANDLKRKHQKMLLIII